MGIVELAEAIEEVRRVNGQLSLLEKNVGIQRPFVEHGVHELDDLSCVGVASHDVRL